MTELATETDRRAGPDSLSFKGIGMIFPDGTEAVRDTSFTVAFPRKWFEALVRM